MSPRRIAKALAGAGLLSLAIIGVVAFWVISGRDTNKAAERIRGLVPNSLLHAGNFHWTQMKGDQKQWELSARDASYSNDKTTVQLDGISLLITLDDGKIIRLKAPQAALTVAGDHVKEARLSGGLEIDYGAMVLTTPAASFRPDDDRITADGAVYVAGQGLRISAIGLEAHPRNHRFMLEREVRTEFSSAGAEKSHQGNS